MSTEAIRSGRAGEQVQAGLAEQPTLRTDVALVLAYGLALIAYALMTPLQVPELEAVGWSVHFKWDDFWYWSAQSIDPSPIANLIQLPSVHFLGISRLATRLPGVLLASGSAFLLLRLADLTVPKRRYGALLLFATLPLQLMILAASVQYEAATFFCIAAMMAFFAIVDRPGSKLAIALAVLTGLTVFTDRHSVLPIFGAVLFLLRFSARPQERRALWFALGACVATAAPYVAYYIWSGRQTERHWLAEPGIPTATFPPYMTPLQIVSLVAAMIMLIGVVIGGWTKFQMSVSRIHRRITLFCLLGAALLSLLLLIAPNYYFVFPIVPRDLMFAAPFAILLFTAALNWVFGLARRAAITAAMIVLVAFLSVDLDLIASPKDNVALEAQYVTRKLNTDSCVVFASEFYSRPIFLLLQPSLESRECREFFHRRVVLVSHPYVGPAQQQIAEGFFRGLNFRETKRIRSGGGEIVVFDTK